MRRVTILLVLGVFALDAYAKYASALKDAGLKAGETPSTDQALKIGQALASLDQQKIATASANIATWAQKNCTS
jgi:hypothetical protein